MPTLKTSHTGGIPKPVLTVNSQSGHHSLWCVLFFSPSGREQSRVALISPDYGRCTSYRGLQFSPIKRITGVVSFRVVLSRKSENGLVNVTKDRICPDNLLGQKHEIDKDNAHEKYTQHLKSSFKENTFYYFLYVLNQRTNSGTGSKLVWNLKQSQLVISLYM